MVDAQESAGGTDAPAALAGRPILVGTPASKETWMEDARLRELEDALEHACQEREALRLELDKASKIFHVGSCPLVFGPEQTA